MPELNEQTLDLLRQEGHRSSFYFSFLKPLTLWTAQVNDGEIARGETSITFDVGSGLDFSAVGQFQELWVGSAPGLDDIGRVRIRENPTSGDSGVTGSVTVASNVIWWEDDHHLTFKHNYPLVSRYPYIDPGDPDEIGDEIFYKDRDIPYTDQNLEPHPVPILRFSQRAGFIRNGELIFWVDASDSYPIADGASVNDHQLFVYPTDGVSIEFDNATGIGHIRVTSLTQEYYWVHLAVTDTNGKAQGTWRCIFAHDPDPDGETHPHTDFNVNQLSGGFDRGGWYTQVLLHDNATLDDIPDRTFCVLWKESIWNTDDEPVETVRDDTLLYVDPRLSFHVTPSGGSCEVEVTFTAGLMDDGSVYPDGAGPDIIFKATGSANDTASSTVTNGVLTATYTFTGGNAADCAGTLTVANSANTLDITSTGYSSGQIVSRTSGYPSPLRVFPRSMIVGYTRSEQLSGSRTSQEGTQRSTLEVTTIEDLLRNEYMFSISLAARPEPETWYEYASWLTIGRAAHHVWRWHSSLFQVANVVGLIDNPDGRAYAEFEDGTLYTMVDTMARQQGIRAHVVCNKDGEVCLVHDPQLLIDVERAAQTTVATVTDDDRSGELVIMRNPERRVALVFVSGFAFGGSFSINEDNDKLEPDADPYCSISPGSHPPHGGGEGTINFDRQVLTSQDQANQLAGRVDAAANNLYPELRVKFHGDYLDVIDFGRAEFWEIDLSSADNLRQIALPDLRIIPRDARVQVDVAGGTVQCNVVFEPEAQANPGVTTECPGLVDLGNFDLPVIDLDDLGSTPGAIVTASSVYYLPPTSDSWVLRTAEDTNDMIQDPFWRLRQSSNASEDAIMWRCGVGYVKRTTDAWVTEADVTPAGPLDGVAVANITFVMMAPNWSIVSEFACVGYYDDAGTWRSWILYTDDDGATWSHEEIL